MREQESIRKKTRGRRFDCHGLNFSKLMVCIRAICTRSTMRIDITYASPLLTSRHWSLWILHWSKYRYLNGVSGEYAISTSLVTNINEEIITHLTTCFDSLKKERPTTASSLLGTAGLKNWLCKTTTSGSSSQCFYATSKWYLIAECECGWNP